MDETPTLQQILDNLKRQVAILADRVDMFITHHPCSSPSTPAAITPISPPSTALNPSSAPSTILKTTTTTLPMTTNTIPSPSSIFNLVPASTSTTPPTTSPGPAPLLTPSCCLASPTPSLVVAASSITPSSPTMSFHQTTPAPSLTFFQTPPAQNAIQNCLEKQILPPEMQQRSHDSTNELLPPARTGSAISLVSIVQTRNNACIGIFESLEMFSSRFLKSGTLNSGRSNKHEKSGNEQFLAEISKWVFHERGYVEAINVKHHKIYVAMLGTYEHELFSSVFDKSRKNYFDKVVFIFDPGGTFAVEFTFVACCVYGDAHLILKLYPNQDYTILTPMSLNYDLEDKVDFEGKVMMRTSSPSSIIAALTRSYQ